MRCVALSSVLFLGVAACGTTSGNESSPFEKPNELMETEIENRVAQIPYQHREELFNSLLWLAQTGEQAIPALLQGLNHREPKVRSNCAWVLGRIGDRRTIPQLQRLTKDSNDTVRFEAARTLVLMGDIKQAPILIEGLDADVIPVRYLCHEALKTATGRDFNYDHLSDDRQARREAAYEWRKWWGEQSGDEFFVSEYARKNGLNTDPAQPNVEWTPPTGEPAAPSFEPARRVEPESQTNRGEDDEVLPMPVIMPPVVDPESKPKGTEQR